MLIHLLCWLLYALRGCTLIIGLPYTIFHSCDKVLKMTGLIASEFIDENILVEVVETEFYQHLP